MAKRLATEYVKSCLQLTEAELLNLIELCSEQQITQYVQIFENGNQEVVLGDNAGDEVVLSFEYKDGKYISEGSCRLNNPELTNLMRKAVSAFKGDAIVNRIYSDFTMIYVYKDGKVVKIVEMIDNEQRMVYAYNHVYDSGHQPDHVVQLDTWFRNQKAENEIRELQMAVDRLLDQRNLCTDGKLKHQIDEQLKCLSHQMFVLEA